MTAAIFLSFPHCPPEGMPSAYKLYKSRSSNVRVSFLLVELSTYGTVYHILSVLLVLLFLRDVLKLLILVSF